MKENYIDKIFNEECLQGLKSLPDNSVDCCITSPPYYALRDYGTVHWEGGDPNCPHYRTSKVSENTATGHKAMMDSGHPVGDAIQEKSKYVGDNRGERGDARRGTNMNSVSGVTGEYRNKRDVWSVNTKHDSVAHFATYPEELITPCILAGCPSGGIVLDPFMGSGTTARAARKLNRHFVGFELNTDYCKIIEKKIQVSGDLFY